MEMPLVSFIVNRLGVLLNEFEEAEFLYGVSRQLVERIQSVLALIPSVLQGADHAIQSYYHVDPRVGNWVAEFGKLAYETEDIVETFVIEFSSRRNKRGFRNHLKIFARISKEWNDIQRVGSEIYDIENKLMDLAVSLHSFGLRRRDSGVRDTNLEALEREMVKLCASLPLAIILLGGLLATKNTLWEWKMVYENVCSHKWGDMGIVSKVYR